MATRRHKKNLIISSNNLSEELKELLKETYPDGYRDHLQKTIKPNGEYIFAAPIETEDTVYMVKFDVKIDTGLVEEDYDKDIYGAKTEDEEFAPLSEALDKEEGGGNAVGPLQHGSYEEILEGTKDEFAAASADFKDEFGSDDDDFDEYVNEKQPDEDDFDDEPNEDELKMLEEEGFLRDILDDDPTTLDTKKKRGRPSKAELEQRRLKEEKAGKKAKDAKPAKTGKVGRPRKSPEEKAAKAKATKAAKKATNEPKASKTGRPVGRPALADNLEKMEAVQTSSKVTKVIKESKAVKAYKESKLAKAAKALREKKTK